MITWMTRMSFFDSADDLDVDALAQAANEASGLMRAFAGDDEFAPLLKEPVSKMWQYNLPALALYANAMVLTGLTKFGLGSITTSFDIGRDLRDIVDQVGGEEFEMPSWVEDTDVLLSHRSNLQRRYPKRFGKTWKGVPKNMPYLWPFVESNGDYSTRVSKSDKALLVSGERVLPKSIKERIENL